MAANTSIYDDNCKSMDSSIRNLLIGFSGFSDSSHTQT